MRNTLSECVEMQKATKFTTKETNFKKGIDRPAPKQKVGYFSSNQPKKKVGSNPKNNLCRRNKWGTQKAKNTVNHSLIKKIGIWKKMENLVGTKAAKYELGFQRRPM